MRIYSAKTAGYKGEPVKGVDRIFETTGDFVSAVFRIIPHANESERYKHIVKQMQSVKLVTPCRITGEVRRSQSMTSSYFRMVKRMRMFSEVPEVNWLPINRRDEDLSTIMRIYHGEDEDLVPAKAEMVK